VQLASRRVPKGGTYWKKLPGRKRATPHTSELFDDLVSTGHLALWEAIKGYNVNGDNRLWAFASKSVTGAISDAAKEWRKRGLTGETRVDRWLFGHANATPEQLMAGLKKLGLKKVFRSLEEAAEYIKEFEERYRFETLSTADGVIEGSLPKKDRAEDDRSGQKHIHALHVRSVFDVFNPRQLAPHLHVHDRISDIVDDLARGRNVEPERYQKVAKYFDEEERQKWKESPKTKPPLPLQRPRRWHGQSRKRRRKSFVARAQSAEGRS
jgi:hypothetical protein